MEASSSTAPPPSKAPRSQFLQKLHSILENPLDPNGLRWVTDDSFEISSKDAVAIHALSPAFEFHSLSSFIRQLSYYSFRRLSDRRRSTERRNSNPGYVLFQHPSGFFVRGDPSQLVKIVRKARTRPEKGRRASECSTASDEAYPASLHPYPMPAWPPSTDYRSSFSTDRPPLQLPSFGSSFNPLSAPSRSSSETTQWRAYAPTTGAWLDPNRGDGDRFGPPRRSSLGEFKLTPSSMLGGESSGYSSTLSSLQEENRPRARKASASYPDEPHHHHAYLGEHASPSHHDIAQGFSASPYPTPTFSPTSNTYFEAAPSSAAHAHGYHHSAGPSSSAFVSASHMSYEPSPFASSYHPVAPSKGGAHSYHTPSPDQSPLQEVVGLPGLVETVPPMGHPAHPSSSATSGGDYGQAQHGDRHASPRSAVSYAPLATLQTRYAASPSSISGLTHAPWQPSQGGQGYSTSTSAGLSSQPYGFAPPPPSTAPQPQSQWSPAPIRHSAY
ncbi:hypothetical protein JCM9279_001725 [Rhodotorula babjevae]